ncbi:hypothetical protein SIO70_26500 [Chitinophaga sancti]|uniref:hypothetical protein n=1 Tax=Chitinophaga sancti TaxID=1004 RepID=UPI002A764286|nr:hypothetical protein [Chitinophaga sancti]WPQ61917.1 hypothetical protein SIO70_26500 [Chitinophaga sancti]
MEYSFTIQNLIKIENGKIHGPLSSILFAEKVMPGISMGFNRLARVQFKDYQTLQQLEIAGLTDHNFLIIGYQGKIQLDMTLWIDYGEYGIMLAKCYNNKWEAGLSYCFNKFPFEIMEGYDLIREIFDYVVKHPVVIVPVYQDHV